MNKKRFTICIVCLMLLAGCGENEIMKTYEPSGDNAVMKTYYEMKDGTWKCDDTIYQFRLELTGRMPDAVKDSCYIVLTDDKSLSFETVSKSLYSSLLKDGEAMKGSVIVEMK